MSIRESSRQDRKAFIATCEIASGIICADNQDGYVESLDCACGQLYRNEILCYRFFSTKKTFWIKERRATIRYIR